MVIDRHGKKPDELETVIKAFIYLVLFILPPILILSGCWNLYMASELGIRDGQSLLDIYKRWQDGIDITRQYSQSYLMAIMRISNAVRQLSVALMMLCGAAVLFFTKQGKKRM